MENLVPASSAHGKNPLSFLTGLLFGGIASIGFILLLAPQSGSKTRGQIKQKRIELQDRATVTFNDLVTLSHFDNRKILAGAREKTEHTPDQASSALETEDQLSREQFLENDSLGG
jgi:gas vesicle protein